jgi:hypothetical protein
MAVPQPLWPLSISTNMDDEGIGGTDNVVTEFSTYEEFLDSQITPLDLYYLEVSINLIKIIVSVCYSY